MSTTPTDNEGRTCGNCGTPAPDCGLDAIFRVRIKNCPNWKHKPSIQLEQLRMAYDRLVAALEDEGLAQRESFDARLSFIINTQTLRAVNRFRTAVIAKVRERIKHAD